MASSAAVAERRFVIPDSVADHPVACFDAGNARVVTCNKPKALNALDLEMVRAMAEEVQQWDASSPASCVVLQGAGAKAFCAGGDIRSLFDGGHGAEGRAMQADFFGSEYQLDNALARSSSEVTPNVALWDGITMGGGVGISATATFRIATDSTMYAMPEVGIGFFPDVGGSHFLPRLPGAAGAYLALSGARLTGKAVAAEGVATHYVPSERVDALLAGLAALPTAADLAAREAAVRSVVEAHAADAGPAQLAGADVAGVFDVDLPAAEIAERLAAAAAAEDAAAAAGGQAAGKGPMARAWKSLKRASPESVVVTVEQCRRGRSLSLEECYAMEYRLAMRFMQAGDFYEGVRAVLVDKDNAPKWRHASVAEVDVVEVAERYFRSFDAADEQPGHMAAEQAVDLQF